MPRERLDRLLVGRGVEKTRAKARESIERGRVRVNGAVATKPAAMVDSEATIDVAKARAFVSRGGEKLDAAMDVFALDVHGAIVVDIGASTGGFTDCVLRRGAEKVYAVDVGHDQLDAALRDDSRVVVRDGVNARALSAADFDDVIDVIVVDASFIALSHLTPAFARILPPGGRLVALVKPQFEVGRVIAKRTRGVVKDSIERTAAIAGARDAITLAGFTVLAECDSALAGAKGNVEHFVYARRVESDAPERPADARDAQSTITQKS